MHAVRARVVVWLALLLACGSPAFALNPALDVNQYAHTAWTVRDGFFNSNINAIAQTTDGYVWVGTEAGLLRFDGTRAVPFQPGRGQRLPGSAVIELLATGDGGLWIGTSNGLASWKDGRLVSYPEFSGDDVATLFEDTKGTVWVGTVAIPAARLCTIREVVVCVGRDGRFGIGVFAVAEDGGTMWVGSSAGLWRWTPGTPTRYPLPAPNVSDLLKQKDGPLLIAMTGGVKQFSEEHLSSYPLSGMNQPFDATDVLFDRDGGLWIATGRRGLIHVHQGRVDAFTKAEGLSSDSVIAVHQDREGNIWVGTSEGLDRFRELPVTLVSSQQGLATDSAVSVLAARDGSVWLGSADGLTRWSNGRTTIYRTPDGLPDNHVGTIFQERSGRILVSTLNGMAAFDGARFVRFMRSVPTRIVYNIVENREGDLWIGDQEQGLTHVIDDQVVTRIPWTALGHEDHATAAVGDRTRGGLWLGFYNGGVAFVKDGSVQTSYATADGLGAGRVAQLRFDDDGGLWAATAAGLSRIKDNRVVTLTTGNGLPCDGVHLTITDQDRSLWLMMPCGLVRIASTELASWLTDSRRSVTYSLFDASDGVRTQSAPLGFTPAAATMANGRLWFATANGAAVVDPRRLPINNLPPPVHIEQLTADRKNYAAQTDAKGRLRLPPRVHDLQIDYTALSLVAPEKVRFRYILEGVDRDWRDVGTRRQAFYTDLPPRQYRFRVAAANNSGVWNETGAAIDFSIAPAYYQSTWFIALSAGMIAELVWGAHRIRLRIVETHQREVRALNERLMKAQEQERIRIAGELHDGVMQQMLAATMMLGTAKRRITGNPDAAATIDKVQDKLIQAGTEIRQLSHDLHPPLLHEVGLPKAVQAHCEQFSTASGIPITCDADESARDLSRGAGLALFRIVQEALGNAAKHAKPKHIRVGLRRVTDVVSLTVSDDGIGFEPAWLATAGSGGLGLVMMRERATQLNGKFEFESAPGRGTTITVKVPFR